MILNIPIQGTRRLKIRSHAASLLFYCLVFSTQMCFTGQAFAENAPNRISLAISGGASMGAYEAGLIWGLIEVLRNADKTGGWAMGGQPRPLHIASIAGTSAGGINTLLAGLAWSLGSDDKSGFSNRIDDNIFRDIWLKPDVNRLLPPNATSPQYLSGDALLSRKDLVAVAQEIAKKWRQPDSFRPGIRIPLGVTVTRVRPEAMVISGIEINNQRFYIPFELRTQADGSARFFFDPNDYPSLLDPAMILMPWTTDSDAFSVSDQQIVNALMTTSAFPIGFGRKRMQYCRLNVNTINTDHDAEHVTGIQATDTEETAMVCPDGYALKEAEFADGGLFDNLPIGLARLLAEDSERNKKTPHPVQYIYLDPERERYDVAAIEDQLACDGDTPPDACREMTFNLASETVVLGGAIGTARKYELYRELTSDNWRLNLSQLSRQMAAKMEADPLNVECSDDLPYFDRQLPCSDRLRHTGRLLQLALGYSVTPIAPPFSANALMQSGIASTCHSVEAEGNKNFVSECAIDTPHLRRQLAAVLTALSTKVIPQEEWFQIDIRRSALSSESDRLIHVTSRGGPITGLLLESFGAFLDQKFRNYDYYVGVYDAIQVLTDNQCSRAFLAEGQPGQYRQCRDTLSERLYHILDLPKSVDGRYVFALMAKREFGVTGGLQYAYDPMPPESKDMHIIHQGLHRSVLDSDRRHSTSGALVSTEYQFFTYLKNEGFQPTLTKNGSESLLTSIMDDPDFWSYELVRRATSRMVHLEKQAAEIYKAREPDPEKREKAHTTLMGAGALTLRTATYKYPPFTFSPSTAPEPWFWRNVIPYEVALGAIEGDILVFWQPTWSFKAANAGIRMGLGFSGGLLNSSGKSDRENFGTIGLDLTRNDRKGIFSGWGVTPAVYHNWENPENADQTSFGMDVHAYLFNNRLRVGFGARDLFNDAGDTLFLTLGVADLPGIVYWLSQ